MKTRTQHPERTRASLDGARTLDALGRGGFTMIEMMIAGAILAIVLYGLGVATLSARRAYQGGTTQDSLTARAQRTVDRIADLVVMSSTARITPASPGLPSGSSWLEFRTPDGWAGGAAVWGSTTRVELAYTATDPNDGFDNDGDGFVDDGDVVLTLDRGTADERAVRIARSVAEYAQGETFNGADDNGNGLTDERGLFFRLNGDQLTISLTLVDRDSQGRNVVRNVSTTVTVRN